MVVNVLFDLIFKVDSMSYTWFKFRYIPTDIHVCFPSEFFLIKYIFFSLMEPKEEEEFFFFPFFKLLIIPYFSASWQG